MHNIKQYKNVLSNEDISYLLNLPDVINAKSNIDKKTSGSEYFTIEISQSIKDVIYNTITKESSDDEVAKIEDAGTDSVSFGTKSAVQMGVEVRTVLDSNGAIGGAAMNDAFLGKMKNIMENEKSGSKGMLIFYT